MNSLDLIIGIHGIVEALKNPHRGNKTLYVTKKGLEELQKRGGMAQSYLEKLCRWKVLDVQEFGQVTLSLYAKQKLPYQRIPGQMLLTIDPLEISGITDLHRELECGKVEKILCLDQITDIQNAAAILRTCAFFGVPFLLMAHKGSFGITPGFYRRAGGGVEHVKMVMVGNLSKALKKLQERGVQLIGLSESGVCSLEKIAEETKRKNPICLILGAENKGLSNAVERCVETTCKLPSQGPIKSLNVSVAGAVAMEKIWGRLS